MTHMRTLRGEVLDPTFNQTSVADSLDLLPHAYTTSLQVSVCYQGELLPERVATTRVARALRARKTRYVSRWRK